MRTPSRPRWAVNAMLSVGLLGAGFLVVAPGAGAATTSGFSVKVNFSDAATTPPSGYVRDFGEPYGARTGASEGKGLTYGWVAPGTTNTPVNMVGFGRKRGTTDDPKLDTMLQMQTPPTKSVPKPQWGDWQIKVPNGVYVVTTVVGDSGPYVNSSNSVDINGQSAVADFVPTTTKKHSSNNRTISVTNGLMTFSAVHGVNTKLDYVTITPVTNYAARPSALNATPGNWATNVDPLASIVADLKLPNGGVADSSLSDQSVQLTKVSDDSAVAGNVSTSGGGDTINFSPTSPLAANTLYRFRVSNLVTDVNNNQFLPYSIVFTTGQIQVVDKNIMFDKVPGVATGQMFTTVTKGPDGKLYAGTLTGQIFRWTINADGTLANPQEIDTVRNHATAQSLAGAPNRTIIGLTFDPKSTASNLILWITDNPMYPGGVPNEPNWSSILAKLTGPNLENYQDVLVHLPRSVKDHEVNSIAFGPDGAMYFPIAAMNAMGDADPTWGNRVENKESATIMRLDVTRLPATLPLNVQSDEGGTYDPFNANNPMTIYATGVRNAFDLVWHSNGHLYAAVNGSAAGGNTPATPATLPAACAHRIDGAWTGPAAPAITSNPVAQTDFVYDVKKGRYYGHPNPARCEWTLDNGNPTSAADPFEVTNYPVGVQPDRNYDLADVYDAGLHASADGSIEYKGNAFGGALNHKLLVVRYSDGNDIETFDVNANGSLSNRTTGISGFTGFNQPLDLTEDTATGNLYVTELGGQVIDLLRPHTTVTLPAPTVTNLDGIPYNDRMVFSTIAPAGRADANQVVHDHDVLQVNNSSTTSPITVSGVQISGPWALTTPPTFPATIPAGGNLQLTVQFTATSGRVTNGTLTVQTNAGSVPVQLSGYWQVHSEQGNEPTLTEIGQMMGYTTNLPATFPSGGKEVAVGDEVLSPYWLVADATKPVLVQQIAAYHTYPHTAPLSYFAKGSTKSTLLFTVDGNSAQSMLPRLLGDPTKLASGSFNPTTAFGLNIGSEHSDDTLNDQTADQKKGCTGQCGHHMRFFPVKDRAGNVVPNEWLMSMDYSAINYDFQDNVYLITNMKPAA